MTLLNKSIALDTGFEIEECGDGFIVVGIDSQYKYGSFDSILVADDYIEFLKEHLDYTGVKS